MASATRFCVYADWLTNRVDDEVLAQIGTDVIPDDAVSETCIYWDEHRVDVLVITWNLDAPDEASAQRLASEAVAHAVGAVLPGRLGHVVASAVDDE